MGGSYSQSGERFLRNTHIGNMPLGKPRYRWEDNIRMDLQEIGVNTSNWLDSAKDRDCWRAPVNTALNLQFP